MNRLSKVVGAALSLALVAACSKSGDSEKVKKLEGRVAKLEEAQKKFAEVEKFLRPIMKQQAAQRAAEEAREPDPNARFAVNIEGDQFDGPADAAVTIVEAFDFA
jgi:hypothetical protein